MEQLEISVGVGRMRDYAAGNLLNAIDDVVSWFQRNTDLSDKHIADALRLYASGMEG